MCVCSVMPDSCNPMDYNLPGSENSMEFSRQEYWSGLPFLASGDLPNAGIKPTFLASPALADGFFATASPGKHFLKKNICNPWLVESMDMEFKDMEGQLYF